MGNARLRRIIKRIIPFGIIWLIFGIIFLVVEYAATKDLEDINNGVIRLDISIILFALPAVTIVGLIIGIIELLFINDVFSKKSFLFKIIGKLIIYSTFLFSIICLTYPIAASIELNVSVFDKQVLDKFMKFLSSITFFSTGFQMSISLIFTLFYNEISEKVGSSAFFNFIIGKYHRPKKEKRIFMFLDMKSSTSIAEKIGHHQYFNLLKEYYNILSEGVIKYVGEVYQYVGDEMVISWRVLHEKEDDNVIRCFFKMKEDLLKEKQYFLNNYGHLPTFKAGIHYGEVTTGELGKIKKDIIFTGDTLNTAARIQSMCNDFSVDILLSNYVLSLLDLDRQYSVKPLGEQKLRGKKEKIELFTIEKKTGS